MRTFLVAFVAATAVHTSSAWPVIAQPDLGLGRSVAGETHIKEAGLEAQLTHNFHAGLLDPLELANMRRDLDAIRVKEEAYCMSKNGLEPGDEAKILAKLDAFQSRLDQRTAERRSVQASIIYVDK